MCIYKQNQRQRVIMSGCEIRIESTGPLVPDETGTILPASLKASKLDERCHKSSCQLTATI